MKISELQAKLDIIKAEYGDLPISYDADYYAYGVMVYTYSGLTQYIELLSAERLQQIREYGKDNELFQKAHRIIE